MIEMVLAHKVEILAFLLALSEALAIIPQVESNSIFQMIFSGLKKLTKIVVPKPKA